MHMDTLRLQNKGVGLYDLYYIVWGEWPQIHVNMELIINTYPLKLSCNCVNASQYMNHRQINKWIEDGWMDRGWVDGQRMGRWIEDG